MPRSCVNRCGASPGRRTTGVASATRSPRSRRSPPRARTIVPARGTGKGASASCATARTRDAPHTERCSRRRRTATMPSSASAVCSSRRLPSAVLAAYLYPRAYWPLVSEAAEAARLDPLLVLALMRQESTFDPEAVSPAAAYGLMQLIIPTAEQVGGTTVTAAELTDPARNIELGTRYLRRLLDRYDGDVAKALAAYNGGEDAVAKWDARAPGSAS